MTDAQRATPRPPDPEREPDREPVRAPVERIAAIATIAMFVAVGVFLYLVREVLMPFVVAGIIAFVCTPLVDALAARTRAPRWLFALTVLLVLLGLTVLAGLVGAPPLAREVSGVLGDLHGATTRLVAELLGDRPVQLIGRSLDADQIATYIVDAAQGWLGEHGRAFDFAVIAFTGLFGILLTFVILAYGLIDAHRLGRGLLWLAPPRHRPLVAEIWRRLNPLLRRYFVGVALVVVYAATAAYIGLGLFLGIHGAVFLALLTGVLEVIPVVGPAASAIIAGLVAMQQATSAWAILSYVIYASALRISIDQFFGPIVLGRAASVSPVLVIFCFLSGGALFGIVGVILAVPVALCSKVVLATVYQEQYAEADE
jgi:predicted PurR-regulated permease PerM